MLISQLEEIRQKVEKRIYEYEQYSLTFPPDCYDISDKLVKKKAEEYIERLKNDLLNQFKLVHYFYNSHEELEPTAAECKEGIQYLKVRGASKTMITWFMESYHDIPVKAKLYIEDIVEEEDKIKNYPAIEFEL